MTRPIFFDSVVHPDHTLGQWVENYFYLDGISNHFGYRKYTVISGNTIERAKKKEITTYLGLIFTTLKILSYIGSLGLIPLSLLVVKGIYRKVNAFQLKEKEVKIETVAAEVLVKPTPHTPEDIIQAEEYIQESMAAPDSKSQTTEPTNFENHFIMLKEELLGKLHGIHPDWKKGNLVQFFANDPKVFFVPDSGHGHNERSTDPSQPGGMKTIIESLKAGFTAGKEMVVIRLRDQQCAEAAAFCKDGSFKIINSLNGYEAVSILKLTEQLNQSGIKDSEGRPIVFKGNYVNTCIQKINQHECWRFATLYGYHMAKAKSLDAYKMVNGAFQEGRFKTFEDYDNIEGVKPLEKVSGNINYNPFMHSWAFRTQGISVDDWRDIRFEDLLKAMPRRDLFETNYNMDFFYLDPSGIVPRYRAFKSHDAHKVEIELKNQEKIIISDPALPLPFEQIPLPDDLSSATLRDLLPANPQERTVIYFAHGDLTKPRVYRLKEHQQFMSRNLEKPFS